MSNKVLDTDAGAERERERQRDRDRMEAGQREQVERVAMRWQGSACVFLIKTQAGPQKAPQQGPLQMLRVQQLGMVQPIMPCSEVRLDMPWGQALRLPPQVPCISTIYVWLGTIRTRACGSCAFLGGHHDSLSGLGEHLVISI